MIKFLFKKIGFNNSDLLAFGILEINYIIFLFGSMSLSLELAVSAVKVVRPFFDFKSRTRHSTRKERIGIGRDFRFSREATDQLASPSTRITLRVKRHFSRCT